MTEKPPDPATTSGSPGGPGGNIAYAAVDRHVATGDGERLALSFVATDGSIEEVSYRRLADDSNRFANVLAALNVAPGERVFTLCGRLPALYICALGTWKAKAVFSALFTSFGPEPIAARLNKGQARVLVTTTSLYRRKIAPIRDAIPSLREILLVDGTAPGCRSLPELMASAGTDFTIPPTDGEDAAFVHFTSGTTGPPKGALHVHAALEAIAGSARLALDLRDGVRYWCTADPGWITGVCYGIIAPLVCGATAIVDQGDFDAQRWYRLLAEQRISHWYTAPTALRMLMRAGNDLPQRFDLSALSCIASVGEPLNPEIVRWGWATLGRTIHDTWWQTETGSIIIANRPGDEVVPGCMGRPLPGVTATVVERSADGGVAVIEGGDRQGELALRRGWPAMFRGYLGEPERTARCFAGEWYLTGDLARIDAEGRFWFVGRADEIITSAGHRIGPFEIESVLMEHPAVAEAGAIGLPDPLLGETVKAFVVLKPGDPTTRPSEQELLAYARRRLGPAIAPRAIAIRPELPRTRSGKIMRRLLKSRELGLADGDTSNSGSTRLGQRRALLTPGERRADLGELVVRTIGSPRPNDRPILRHLRSRRHGDLRRHLDRLARRQNRRFGQGDAQGPTAGQHAEREPGRTLAGVDQTHAKRCRRTGPGRKLLDFGLQLDARIGLGLNRVGQADRQRPDVGPRALVAAQVEIEEGSEQAVGDRQLLLPGDLGAIAKRKGTAQKTAVGSAIDRRQQPRRHRRVVHLVGSAVWRQDLIGAAGDQRDRHADLADPVDRRRKRLRGRQIGDGANSLVVGGGKDADTAAHRMAGHRETLDRHALVQHRGRIGARVLKEAEARPEIGGEARVAGEQLHGAFRRDDDVAPAREVGVGLGVQRCAGQKAVGEGDRRIGRGAAIERRAAPRHHTGIVQKRREAAAVIGVGSPEPASRPPRTVRCAKDRRRATPGSQPAERQEPRKRR